MKTKTERFRFDDAYGMVSEHSKEAGAYLFLCSYYAAGITAKDSDKTKHRKVIAFLEVLL